MAAGKRLDVTDPLTEHDVADRLDKAALRVVRIMLDLRLDQPWEFREAVKASRYNTNILSLLRDELDAWFLPMATAAPKTVADGLPMEGVDDPDVDGPTRL